MLIEMHAHTSETSTCGKLSAEDLISRCERAGYDAVVITDHLLSGSFDDLPTDARVARYLKGYYAAKQCGDRIGVNVLLGVEARFPEWGNEDYLIYGPEEADIARIMEVLDRNEGIEDLHDFAREAGMLVIQAHPNRTGINQIHSIYLDGVEVFNGNPRQMNHNDRTREYAEGKDLILTSGSDAHQVEDIGRGGISAPDWVTDNASLVRYLKEVRQPERRETEDK